MFLQLLTQAAQLNNSALALGALADLYRDGSASPPVAADPATALQLYRLAGDAGLVEALVTAGAMTLRGVECDPDPREAFLLYERAAHAGSADAWRNLAALHAQGLGTPQSLEAAQHIARHILPALEASQQHGDRA
jgi:TPR repeat protein